MRMSGVEGHVMYGPHPASSQTSIRLFALYRSATRQIAVTYLPYDVRVLCGHSNPERTAWTACRARRMLLSRTRQDRRLRRDAQQLRLPAPGLCAEAEHPAQGGRAGPLRGRTTAGT